jgi:hypothetical protein
MLFRPLFLSMCLAQLVSAPAAAAQGSSGVVVSGVVYDSLARAPLAGASVQLVTDKVTTFIRTADTDSLGRFTLTDVPAGQYKLGFLHPLLDSIGVDAPVREVRVAGQPVRADLAVPAPHRIRTAICGPRPAGDSSSVLVGVVRNAHDRSPAESVSVTGQWLEYSFSATGLARRTPKLVARTGDNGWFAMCNIPSGGMLGLTASRGADSTDLIEVPLSSDGFVRRDLYLGSARSITTAESPARAGVTGEPRRLIVGDVRLTGVVVAGFGGQPIANAQVGIVGGSQTRTNQRGEWAIADAPAGTRMLEVRAVGYYPERRPVNAVAGAAPLRVALSTLRAMLDTVKIVAARVRGRDIRGFLDRSRTGLGRYLTEEAISRRGALVTSDLFRSVAGLQVERTPLGDTQLTMRSNFGDDCVPNFFLDGQHMKNLSADDINGFVDPREIAGIEVYAGTEVPPQFQSGLSGCGSIVVWTK